MWDFSVRGALGLMAQTLPFLLLRLAVYLGAALGYVLVTGIGAGTGYGLGTLFGPDGSGTGAIWGGLIGFGVFGAFMYWAREYLLYLVKAGHISVLVKRLHGQVLPQGRSQIAYARDSIKTRFAQASVLFAIDQLVKGVIKALIGLVRGMLSAISLPGAQQLSAIVHAFLRMAVGFIDEVILARTIHTESDNPWGTARDSLVLYGQNYRIMMKNAAWLAVIVYVFSFLVFLLMLAPAAALVYWMPGTGSAASFVFALLFAWSIKVALLEPFAMACLMDVYFRTIEGQTPNPEWEARMEQMSDKFRSLGERARAAIRSKPETPGEATATAS